MPLSGIAQYLYQSEKIVICILGEFWPVGQWRIKGTDPARVEETVLESDLSKFLPIIRFCNEAELMTERWDTMLWLDVVLIQNVLIEYPHEPEFLLVGYSMRPIVSLVSRVWYCSSGCLGNYS